MHNSIVILSSEKIVSYEVIISLGKLCTGAEKFLREIMQLPTRNSEEPKNHNQYKYCFHINANKFQKQNRKTKECCHITANKYLKKDTSIYEYVVIYVNTFI